MRALKCIIRKGHNLVPKYQTYKCRACSNKLLDSYNKEYLEL
jgi:hypothetical protein